MARLFVSIASTCLNRKKIHSNTRILHMRLVKQVCWHLLWCALPKRSKTTTIWSFLHTSLQGNELLLFIDNCWLFINYKWIALGNSQKWLFFWFHVLLLVVYGQRSQGSPLVSSAEENTSEWQPSGLVDFLIFWCYLRQR